MKRIPQTVTTNTADCIKAAHFMATDISKYSLAEQKVMLSWIKDTLKYLNKSNGKIV
jgi:predicted choloylglycine hydrolase